MKKYMLFDTGEVYTLEELKDEYEKFESETVRYDPALDEEVPRYEDFDAYMEEMLSLGRQKIGGLIPMEEADDQ